MALIRSRMLRTGCKINFVRYFLMIYLKHFLIGKVYSVIVLYDLNEGMLGKLEIQQEQSSGDVLLKKALLKISQNSRGITCAIAFFNKVAIWRPVTLLKRGSCTGVFL